MLSSVLRMAGRAAGLAVLGSTIVLVVLFALLMVAIGALQSWNSDAGPAQALCAVGALEGPACPGYGQELEDAQHVLLITQERLAAAEADLAQAGDRLARLRRLDGLADSWTAFRSEHPDGLGGAEVTTGSRYSTLLGAGDADGLEGEYCYVSKAKNGVAQQITLTHDARRWATIDRAAADTLGLSLEALTHARGFCRFVGPGPDGAS